MILLKKVIANFFASIFLTFAFCLALYFNAIAFAIIFGLLFASSVLLFSKLIREAEEKANKERKQRREEINNIWKDGIEPLKTDMQRISNYLDTLTPKNNVRPGSKPSEKYNEMREKRSV